MDLATKFAIQRIIDDAWQIAEDHGWHDVPTEDGTQLALIHSEISEALQALRDGSPPDKHIPEMDAVTVELADAVIRIFDFCQNKKLKLSDAIDAKMEFNKTRPYRHGKEF